jgi:tape measure domain-containing protein
MSNDLTLAIKLTTEGGKVIVKDFTDISVAAEHANKSLLKSEPAGAKANQGFRQAGSGAKAAKTDFDGARRSADSMLNTLKLLVGGVSLGLLSKEVKDYSDVWKLANNQLRQVIDTEKGLTQSRSELLAVARATNTDLLGTVELFTSFERGTRSLGLAQNDVINITTTMNNLLLAGGKSAAETSGAIRQLNQGLEAGALRGDEFNSVAEGAPRVLDALSLSLGMARGELREFAATGGITAQILATALLNYQGTAQHMADITVRTFDQQMNNAKTNIIEFVGESQLLNYAVDNTGSSLVFLSQNIEGLTYAVGAAGAVYAASYIPALGASIIKQYQMVVGTQMAAAAEAQYAKTQLTRIASTVSAATAEAALSAANVANIKSVLGQIEAEAALENVRLKAQITQQGRILTINRMAEIQTARLGIIKNLTIAESQLLSANKLATAASGAQTAATASLTTAQAAATRTSYALGVATRFLLGPYGLLLAAVGAATTAFYLSAEASKADEEAKTKQAEKVEKLLSIYNAMRESNPAQFSEVYVAAQKKAIEIDTKLIGLKEKLNSLTQATMIAPGANIGKKSALTKEIYELTAAQLNNNQALAAMNESFDKGITSLENWQKPAKEVVRFTSDMNKELNALIDTIDPAGASLRQYGEDYDLLIAAYGDGNLTYEKTIKLIDLLDKQFAEKNKTVDKSEDANKKYLKSLTDELELTKFFGKELAVQTALQKLNIDVTAKQTEEQIKQIAAVRELAGSLYDQAEAAKGWDISSLIDQTNDFASAWGNVGNVIVDAFGSAADQLNRFAEQQDTYIKKLNDIAKARAGQATNPDIDGREKALKQLSSLEDKLREQNTRAQLGAFGSMLGAASNMFSEQSKGREALHRAEQVFTAVEIALAFQKASANALTAITSAFAAPFPMNFAMGAAMIAIMSGLGLFSSSSGGSIPSAADVQADQGTGSVLGSDDKSESLANSFDRFEDIELDQLAELQGIRQSMRELNSGIAQLAKSFVTGLDFNGGSYDGQLGKFSTTSKLEAFFIDPTGILSSVIGSFSTTKKTLLDSGITFLSQTLGDILDSGDVQANLYNTIKTTKKKFWGLSSSTKTSIEYSDLDSAISQQMAAIFGFVGESIVSAADLLGFSSAANKLDSFKINLPQISFKDLSGEEIQKELEAIFSQQADLIATYLIPSITNYQQIGEGAYETLLRVAQEQAVFNDHLERTGVVLNGLSNIDLIDVSQNIISLMGGLDAFKDASNTFFTEFFSEQEQFAYLQKSLSDVLATMNLSLPESKDGFKDLVQGIDITTAEGQSLYATLLQVSGAAAEYYDQLEQQTGVLQDNSKLLAQRAAFESDIADALARMDFTSLQTALVDLNGWYQEQIDQAAALGADTTLLEQLYGRKRADVIADALTAINTKTESEMAALTKTHESAVSALTANYQQLFDAINAVSATIASSVLELQRAMTGWNEVAYQAAEVTRLRDQLDAGDISQQTNAVEQLIAATMNKWRAELAVNDAAISKTEQLIGEHESAVAELDSTYSDLFSTINGVAGSISSSILAIRRSMSGWNEVGYQNSNISQLYGQVGAGSIAEQTSTVQGLIDAINDRYQAELANNNELSNAANERYQAELSAYESLKNAAESLKKAADSLLLGDLSYLSQGDQLAEAKKQYEQALASGDIANLQSAGTDYLKIAQEYFSTGSNQYGDIFDQVNSAFRSVNVGGAPSAPAVSQYQNDNLALQQSTIDELSGLQLLLDDLNAQALAQQELEAAALQEQLTGLNTELLALQLNANELAQLAIDEISSLQLLLNDLNTQAIAQQTTDLTALQSTLDADLVALLASSAEQINAVNAMSNNIVAAINAIDVAPVIIAPAAPAPTTSTTETKTTTNSNVADFSRDVLPVAQNNDAVVAAVKAVKDEMINMRRDLKETNSLVYSNMRIA